MLCEDVNPKFTVRCSLDGVCVEKEADCPLLEPQDQQIGQEEKGCKEYMCQTGQCAKEEGDCLLSHNGCEQKAPHKCLFSGLCVKDSNECSPSPLEYLSL